MFRWKKDQDLRDQAQEYATHYDFREIFTDDAAGLRLLAHLLTGNRRTAEHCLVEGLSGDPQDNPAFHKWAHSWSKRTIIKNAIQAISPSFETEGSAREGNSFALNGNGKSSARDSLASAVSCLPAFERFVFIMSLVEGYSLQECAALLGAAPQQVTIAKSRAVEHVASLLPVEECPQIAPAPLFQNERTA